MPFAIVAVASAYVARLGSLRQAHGEALARGDRENALELERLISEECGSGLHMLDLVKASRMAQDQRVREATERAVERMRIRAAIKALPVPEMARERDWWPWIVLLEYISWWLWL